jgi:hypothetical protein
MTLNIELPVELAARVREEAEKQKQTPEEYVLTLLDLILDPPEPSPFCGTPAMDRKREAFLKWWQSRHGGAPPEEKER